MHRDDDADDRDLLRSVSGHDDDAFWTVWQQHKKHLYAVSLRHMSGMQADADDAMSRSMMVAHEKLPDYAAHIVNLEAWLTRLTSNVCLDMHREQQRARGGVTSIEDMRSDQEPAAQALSPEDEYLLNEVRNTIDAAIASLPPRLRSVAQLRFLHEMSYEAIAETLTITAENARKRVQQARAVLRERVGGARRVKRLTAR